MKLFGLKNWIDELVDKITHQGLQMVHTSQETYQFWVVFQNIQYLQITHNQYFTCKNSSFGIDFTELYFRAKHFVIPRFARNLFYQQALRLASLPPLGFLNCSE